MANKVEVSITGSKYTLKDLSQFLSLTDSYSSRLSVIAHIDCNCFFAQVERNRLGLKVEDPVVCVQWHSIIAVSYAARAYGISRMDKLVDAKLKCPTLIPVHTAVFKKNNDYWEYLDNQAFPTAADHKVSLDPYRRASFKILRLLKNITKNVEKASVDEWFINLNELIYLKLMDLIPDFNIDSLNKYDPLPDLSTILELKGLLYDFDPETDKVTDYDDLFIILGGIVSNEIREEVYDKLQYFTSCGVSNNKKMAKLLSNFKKPNEQTILLNYKISKFLENFKLDDVNSFGGKVGAELMHNFFGDQSISSVQKQFDLLKIQKLVKDDKLALKIFEIINGQYKEPFSLDKDIIKSMNSNKNLLNGKNGESFQDCKQWIKIFAIDLKQRLIEYNNELDKFDLKPRNLTIRVKPKGPYGISPISKTSQIKFQMGTEMHEVFFAKGLELLSDIEKQFQYPLVNIGLTISNFDLISKQENTILQLFKNVDSSGVSNEDNEMMFVSGVGKTKDSNKKIDIVNLFRKSNKGDSVKDVNETAELGEATDEGEVLQVIEKDPVIEEGLIEEIPQEIPQEIPDETSGMQESDITPSSESIPALGLPTINPEEGQIETNSEIVDNYKYSKNSITCTLCDLPVEDIIEHNDYHFALKLNEEINTATSAETLANSQSVSNRQIPTSTKKGGNKRRKKNDGNQSRLPF